MKSTDALPHAVVRKLYEHIQRQGLGAQPREAVLEAFAFTQTGTPEQIARALGYSERVVNGALEHAARNFHRVTPAVPGHEGWQAR